jgi:DNA-binding XRE family transcriptional regulator
VSDKLRLAKNLRMARVAAGLTQTAVAELVGKSRQTLNAWEREDEDAPMPDEWVLGILAAAYSTTPSALRYGDAAKVSETPPRYQRNLPLAVRELLAESRLEMVKAGALDEEIEEAIALMRSAAVFTFYEGGAAAPRDFNEADVLKGMHAIYSGVIKPELKQRGRNL